MKKIAIGIILLAVVIALFGCWSISHTIRYIFEDISMDLALTQPDTPVILTTVIIEKTAVPSKGPVTLATALLAASPTPTPAPPPTATATPTMLPTPVQVTLEPPHPTGVPDHIPGSGMAVLSGDNPYYVSLNAGGWQAFLMEGWPQGQPVLVDVTPLASGEDTGTQRGAYAGSFVEWKIVPEYFGSRWVDTLWLRAPGALDGVDLQVKIIPVEGWNKPFASNVVLNPGDWMGMGMFATAEGCGGVLAIELSDDVDQPAGAYIQNFRVQPEFPGPDWIQVARVQLWVEANKQPAVIRYYTPGDKAQEIFRMETTLTPGSWNGFRLTGSEADQAYVVEVIPLEKKDNEVAFSVVRPEFDGESWQDVLRVYVPEGRPPLKALLRVLAVRY